MDANQEFLRQDRTGPKIERVFPTLELQMPIPIRLYPQYELSAGIIRFPWPMPGRWFAAVLAALLLVNICAAADLSALPEYLRPDPFGNIVAVDRAAVKVAPLFSTAQNPLSVTGARGGYVSFQLVVKMPEGGDYKLDLKLPDRDGKLQLDLFREWFHWNESGKAWYPDALIPANLPYTAKLPDAGNRIDKQSAQAFWVDVWIPSDAVPGTYRCQAVLQSGQKKLTLPVDVSVVAAQIPVDDAVIVDHNSYGSSFLADQYSDTSVPSDESFRLTQLYHRLFYEHRGVYHQLGYGHGGKVIAEFAPQVAGSGRGKRIESWDLYDRHYGPLLDGSAFAGSRRGVRPIPFVYLPINPEWPASFLWWGEPGYEVEFTNVVSQMERHFREKGWTHTRFEMFFNHKKRYKAFPWDGDEVRFPEDDKFFLEYGRLLKKALPSGSPVQFVFRTDASWSMESQFDTLAGIINFWVCSGGMFSWYPEAAAKLKSRGDIVWIYGGPPAVNVVSSAITDGPVRAWIYGTDGWVHWQTVDAGPDPWFHAGGLDTVLAYSGDRFGIKGPVPSLRLKLQRNCLQDLALIDSLKRQKPLDWLKAEVTRQYNGSKPGDWWNPRPPLLDRNPYTWAEDAPAEPGKPTISPEKLSAGAWNNVHRFLMDLVVEAK
jgi:hypothetical protein